MDAPFGFADSELFLTQRLPHKKVEQKSVRKIGADRLILRIKPKIK